MSLNGVSVHEEMQSPPGQPILCVSGFPTINSRIFPCVSEARCATWIPPKFADTIACCDLIDRTTTHELATGFYTRHAVPERGHDGAWRWRPSLICFWRLGSRTVQFSSSIDGASRDLNAPYSRSTRFDSPTALWLYLQSSVRLGVSSRSPHVLPVGAMR
jgi:hypothetical protein